MKRMTPNGLYSGDLPPHKNHTTCNCNAEFFSGMMTGALAVMAGMCIMAAILRWCE